jgi:muramoyltetrapeptide carboxypeptidase
MLLRPRPLAQGGTIGLFSPSGALLQERLDAGVATIESQGYRAVVAPEAHHEWRYFAGTDDERLASFHRMVADPAIDAMMMSRGGYGLSRLLHRIDWPAVAASRKVFCGFSDFTAFSLAALAKVNFLTYAGPGGATDFDWRRETPEAAADHAFMTTHCWPALGGEPVQVGPFASPHGHHAQTIRGPIWGGNLSLLTHLVGTPFMPEVNGGILFVEEIDEEPYAIERMFLQLFHAGILQRQRAIVLGDFTDCVPSTGRFAYELAHVVETLGALLACPVLTGLPFGHVARKLTIPFGGEAVLKIEAGAFSVSF